MNFNFYAQTEFLSEKLNIARTVQLPFDTRLDKLAFLLFASLMEEEAIENYSFLLRFGGEIYVTKKDVEEYGYQFSDPNYHILEEEKLINPIMRHAEKATFEIVDLKRQDNLVFTMMMGPLQPQTDQKLELLDGKNRFDAKLETVDCDFKEISSLTKKNLKKIKELNR